MSEKESILSICIPTYNRDYALNETLGLMCPIMQKYGIVINISDNASPDNTETIVRKYIQQYPGIINYIKQDENIGPDRNFEFVLRMSNSKYRWLMGDCCFIPEESLQILLADLKSAKEWAVIVANDIGKRRVSGEPINYDVPATLLKDIGWHMTWLSALIYSDKVIEHANFQRYHNSNFIQTGIIFEYFVDHDCSVRLNPNIVIGSIDVEKRGHWTNIVFEIFVKRWYHFVMSLPIIYPIESKQQCVLKHGIQTRLFRKKQLRMYRRNNYLNWGIFRDYKRYMPEAMRWYEILYAFYLLFIPIPILKVLHTIKRGVKGYFKSLKKK